MPVSIRAPGGLGLSRNASAAALIRSAMGRSSLPSERMALGLTPVRTGWRSRVETEFGPDLLGRDRYGTCLDLGQRLPGRLCVGEVLKEVPELLRGEVFQFRCQLRRDDRRQPLPVLGQVHDLASCCIVRSRGDIIGCTVEWNLN